MQNNKARSLPKAIININKKWVNDLNTRAKTIKLLKENGGGESIRLWVWQWILCYGTKSMSDEKY